MSEMTTEEFLKRQADPNDPWYRPPLSDFEQSVERERTAAHERELTRQASNQRRFDKLSRAAQNRILDQDWNDR